MPRPARPCLPSTVQQQSIPCLATPLQQQDSTPLSGQRHQQPSTLRIETVPTARRLETFHPRTTAKRSATANAFPHRPLSCLNPPSHKTKPYRHFFAGSCTSLTLLCCAAHLLGHASTIPQQTELEHPPTSYQLYQLAKPRLGSPVNRPIWLTPKQQLASPRLARLTRHGS
jgi:hypothetical protein